MSRAPLSASPGLVAECLAMVAPASDAFLSRWRLSTLRRASPALADLLEEQRVLYDRALLAGTDAEAREQSAAMVRGWRAACAALESPLLPDDAYLTGSCARTGLQVVVGHHPSSVARVQAHPTLAGINVLFVTPSEVASMLSATQMLASCKHAFPDAELIEIYPQDGTPHIPAGGLL